MAKRTAKQREEVLEDILFSCRDSLRGRAALTDKRDMLLTLVFLKFISKRYHDKRNKILDELAEDPEFAQIMATKKSAYGQDGVFMLDV